MRTQAMLEKLPEKNKEDLKRLKELIARAKEKGQFHEVERIKDIGKGYIKALEACGVICDFKTAWCWFTL